MSLTPDERIRCAECRWISQDGRKVCLVAEKRKGQFADGHRLKGDHPWWTYRPHLEILRRCEFGQRRDSRIDGNAPERLSEPRKNLTNPTPR